MQIFYFLQIYEVCLLIHVINGSRVLLAGNKQAFQNLAKDFVPQKLAFELARLIATTSEPYGYNEWDTEVAEPAIVQPHYNWDEQEDKISNENNQYVQERLNGEDTLKQVPSIGTFVQYSEESRFKAPVPQLTNETQRKSVRLNMDELVNKVKDKILTELGNSSNLKPLVKKTNKREIPSLREKYKKGLANQDHILRYGQKVSRRWNFTTRTFNIRTTGKSQLGTDSYVVPLINYHISAEYGSDQVGFSESQESLRRKKKDTIISPLASLSVNKPPGFQSLASKTHVGEVVESHDLYKKVRLKKKGKKDSYEDYVFPEKDLNPFDNDGVYSPVKVQESASSKKFKELSKSATDLRYLRNQNANKTVAKGSKHKQLRQADKARYTKTTKSVKKSTTTDKTDDIFEDDSENEEPDNSEKEQEPRAATMFIDADYEDYPQPNTVTTIGPIGYKNSKRAKMKIITNMATRTRYTPKHINYYEKLARIPEKYNFDEPIPEKDREDETPKNKTKKQPA